MSLPPRDWTLKDRHLRKAIGYKAVQMLEAMGEETEGGAYGESGNGGGVAADLAAYLPISITLYLPHQYNRTAYIRPLEGEETILSA